MQSWFRRTEPLITNLAVEGDERGASQRSQKDGGFSFLDCSFTVKSKRKLDGVAEDKLLIDGVSGVVKAGEVCAIMGPSGAGKTTLLNMLTLEPMGGVGHGVVTLNNQPFDKDTFTKHAAYVPQTDQCWAMLTCRQHVEYAMQLYQPSLSAEDRRVACDELLRDLGLESCQDTIAGNILIKGLSGGAKASPVARGGFGEAPVRHLPR
eukprot:6484264-Prymnesium_polylepis.1